jgi:hypothetical protein
MVRIGAFATLAALAGCGSSAPKAAERVPFTSKAGRYSVVFPAKPDTFSAPTGNGAVKRVVSTAMASKAGDSYGVAYSDYSADELKAGPAAVLSGVRDVTVREVLGTLVSSKDITLAGHPGLDVVAKVDKGATKGNYRVNFYLVGNRVYEVLVVRNQTPIDEEKTTAFLDSFELTGS